MTVDLVLQRPIVSFDLETTGLDVQNDRIIEISCIKILPDGRRDILTRRCNPGVPIGPDATRVHGMTDADVAGQPSFASLAPQLLSFFRDADLTGFNIEQFDLPMLRREFERVEVVFPEAPVHIIDSWRIFLRNEPRDLAAAYRFYCGASLKDAHSAEADAQAAANILLAQIKRYPALPRSVEDLHAYCHQKNPDFLDPDGKVRWLAGKAVLSFGRYRNQPLQSLAENDPEYLRWVASANFSEAVVKIVKAALDGVFPQISAHAETPKETDSRCAPAAN